MGALLFVPRARLHWPAAWSLRSLCMGAASMYSGAVLFFVGAPLLLGSWWGVAMSPLFFALFAIRVAIEEAR